MPSCSESILGEAVESVQGNQVYLDWIGISGTFEMMAQPLQLLSKFNLRKPPLEEQREHWVSFPNKAGNWTVISR